MIPRDRFFAELKADGVEDIVVIGVAADYCVRWAIDGLIARDFRVTVPVALTRGIDGQSKRLRRRNSPECLSRWRVRHDHPLARLQPLQPHRFEHAVVRENSNRCHPGPPWLKRAIAISPERPPDLDRPMMLIFPGSRSRP